MNSYKTKRKVAQSKVVVVLCVCLEEDIPILHVSYTYLLQYYFCCNIMYAPSSREDSEIDHHGSDVSENYEEDDDMDFDESGDDSEGRCQSGASRSPRRRRLDRPDPGYSSSRSSSQEFCRESSEFSDVSCFKVASNNSQ